MAMFGEFDDDAGEYPEFWWYLFQHTLERRAGTDPDEERYAYLDAWIRAHPEEEAIEEGRCTILAEELRDIWRQFWEFMTSRNRALDVIQAEHPWQIWLLDQDTTFRDVGLPNCERTVLLREAKAAVHYYDGLPDPIRLELHVAQQGAVNYYIGTALVREIDAICTVPSMPNHGGPDGAAESARWALTRNIGQNQWQRRMNPRRVLAIRTFADTGQENLILNSVMLYIPPKCPGVVLDAETGVLEVDFSQFLEEIGGHYLDHRSEEGDAAVRDLRPIWILDGQHRTRGLALSARGSEMRIPITVMAGGDNEGPLNRNAAAKLFTEINTLAKPLNEHLRFYLAYKFSIQGGDRTNDFALPGRAERAVRLRRRANREAYRLAASLGREPHGAMFASIQMSESNSAACTHVKVGWWLQEVRKWFGAAPYPEDTDLEQDDWTREVSNYFEAWQENCNHADWDNRPLTPRWVSNRGGGQSYVERRTGFRNVVLIYSLIVSTILGQHPDVPRPLTRDHFLEALAPLRFVDWKSQNLLRTFNRGGEQIRGWVLRWMEQAVEGGEQHPEPEVMTDEGQFAGVAGAGLFCAPVETEIQQQERWPIPDLPVVLRIPRPSNADRNLQRVVLRSGRTIFDDGVLETVSRDDESIVTINHDERMNGMDHLDFSARWNNPNTGTPIEHRIDRN